MTVYVLDSHPLMCQAISFLLRRIDPSKKVVEVHFYSKIQEALLINGSPEAFVMEPIMAGISGTAGIKKIKSNYPEAHLILFSSIPSEEAKNICLLAGADLYVDKTSSSQEVFDLIRNQLDWTNKAKLDKPRVLSAEGLVKLSKRQKQLLPLVDAGLCNEDIASSLGISAHTVKVHLWRLYKKAGIKSRTQLVKFARDNGYL